MEKPIHTGMWQEGMGFSLDGFDRHPIEIKPKANAVVDILVNPYIISMQTRTCNKWKLKGTMEFSSSYGHIRKSFETLNVDIVKQSEWDAYVKELVEEANVSS